MSSNYWISAQAGSYCVVLRGKQMHGGCNIFFVQNIQNKFICEAKGLSCTWCCRYVRWIFWVREVVGKVPCSQLASFMLLNLQFCWWCFEALLNSEEYLPQLPSESAQRGFLSGARRSKVTESQSWTTPQQKAAPRTSFSVCIPLQISHSVSLSEDAALSPSFKAPIEMYQEDKNVEVWEHRCICHAPIVVQSCAYIPWLIYLMLSMNRPNEVTIPKFCFFSWGTGISKRAWV